MLTLCGASFTGPSFTDVVIGPAISMLAGPVLPLIDVTPEDTIRGEGEGGRGVVKE